MARTTGFNWAFTARAASGAARALAGSAGLDVAVHASLGEIDPQAWDSLQPGAAEGYDLYRVLEEVPPPSFELGSITASLAGRLVAAAPAFSSVFRLDTPFQGRIREITDRIHARVPWATSLKIVGLGSPMSDNCSAAIARDLPPAVREAARAALLEGLAGMADAQGAHVLVVKSLGPEATEWRAALAGQGYGEIRNVPVVMLPLPYASLEHYLASLPEKTGSYFRRKLRPASKLRIEYRNSIEGLEGRINQLHDATLAQSSVDYGNFDKLDPGFFPRVLAGLGDRARMMLCWKGDQLLSFQLFIVGDKRVIASRIGMQYPEAREYNLYFINWLKMIEFAIERGIPEIEMGSTTFASKLLFGGHLEPRYVHLRLRNSIANRLTRPLHGLFDFERNDPELQRLRAAKEPACR